MDTSDSSEPLTAATVNRLRLEYVDPLTLTPNPKNWKIHPTVQKDALDGSLDEVGWAGALLFNERSNKLVDGHARLEVALRKGLPFVPVLVGSWSSLQEAQILATLDPLGYMAETDSANLDIVLRSVQTVNQALADVITRLAEDAQLIPAGCEPDPVTSEGTPRPKRKRTRKSRQQEQPANESRAADSSDSDSASGTSGDSGETQDSGKANSVKPAESAAAALSLEIPGGTAPGASDGSVAFAPVAGELSKHKLDLAEAAALAGLSSDEDGYYWLRVGCPSLQRLGDLFAALQAEGYLVEV